MCFTVHFVAIKTKVKIRNKHERKQKLELIFE